MNNRTHIEDIGSVLVGSDFVHIWMYGTLDSYRDEKFNKSSIAKFNNLAKKRIQDLWSEKTKLLGADKHISKLFDQSLANGFKLGISVVVHRRLPIRDYKNLVVGFDHAILDGWVRHKFIKDDSMKYINWSITQLTKKESEEYTRDMVFIMMSQSLIPYKG